MAESKRYDLSQSILIAVFFEEQLMPGTLEFAIHTLVETRMDMSIFDNNYIVGKLPRKTIEYIFNIDQYSMLTL